MRPAAKKLFPMQVVWIFAPLLLLEIARIMKQRAKVRRATTVQQRVGAV
jgi:hypothetical protein